MRSQLRGRVSDLEAQVLKLTRMLPDDNGEFTSLRAEVDELEEDCDYYYGLFKQEHEARKEAQGAIRQALGGCLGLWQGLGWAAGAAGGIVAVVVNPRHNAHHRGGWCTYSWKAVVEAGWLCGCVALLGCLGGS